MNTFDLTVFHAVNQLAGHHPLLDTVMIVFAQYSPWMYAALFSIAWFALPRGETTRRHALVVAACGGILALLINLAIAHCWYRSRPFVALPHGTFTQLIAHVANASFPSDHVSGAFGFSAASWGRGSRWVSWAFTLIAVIVMVARVYTGLHWPTDVLGGLAVGILAGRAIWLLAKPLYIFTRFGVWLTRRQIK